LKLVFDLLRRNEFLRTIDFIKQNPNSYSSLVNFKRLLVPRIDPDSLLSIYGFFSKDLHSTPLGTSVYLSIKRKQSLRLKAEVPLFSFKTNDGYIFNLSSFRNKQYVLLCFWASWCGPCIRNIPFLKVIEQEYRLKGLQVVSVSIDDDPQKWLDAVEKYSMPWLQSCDLPPYITDAKVRSLYELDFIPQYFLIDKEGKMIYQNILSKDNDEHSALKQVLEKVLY
jgi:thiol-disulfide isomerase/thioredoxin